MPKSHIEKQIQDRVDSLVAELSDLVRQAALEAVREALGAGPAPKRPGRPRSDDRVPAAAKKKRGKVGKRHKRSSGQVDAVADRILGHVKANPGTGVTDIGAALGMTSKDMRLPILKLLAEKKLKTVGQKRGTKYHPAGGSARTAPRAASKRKARKKTAKKTPRRKTKRTKKKAGKK